MRFFRQFIGEQKCGRPLAMLIAVLLCLQALVGGFGFGAMAAASTEIEVICSSDGESHHVGDGHDHHVEHAAHEAGADAAHHHGHDGSHAVADQPADDHDGMHAKHGMDCCLTACQVAASAHAGIPAKPPQPSRQAIPQASAPATAIHAASAPRSLGLSRDARGPPVLPI